MRAKQAFFRLSFPVFSLASVACGIVCIKTSFDPSIRGGYFESGSILPFIWIGLLCVSALFAFAASRALPRTCENAAANENARPLAVLPLLGILLAGCYTFLRNALSLQVVVSTLFLLAGALYFATFFMREEISSHLRFIAGLAWILYPVYRLAMSYVDWYVALNAPLKILFQITLACFSLFFCEEMRGLFKAPNRRAVSLVGGLCTLLGFTLGAMALCGGVTDPITDGVGTLCLIFCLSFYTGGRWFFATAPEKCASPEQAPAEPDCRLAEPAQPENGDSRDETDKEDENHVG